MNQKQKRQYWQDELAFSHEEYKKKLNLCQQQLKHEHLSAVLVFDPENIFWLSGFQTIGYFTFQCLVVPKSGLPVLITRIVNRDLALALPTVGDVVAVKDTDNHIDILSNYLNSILANNEKVGLETQSSHLSVADYQQLTQRVDMRFTCWGDFILRQRIIKTAEQINRMQTAARAVEAGMQCALESIAPGKTENDIAAALYQGSIAAGSEYIGHPPMVVAGKRTALCFALWKRNTIKKGDVVLLEGGACIDRYHALMARSAVVGKPTDEHKATAQALIEILETAIETIKPGEPAGEIDYACRKKVERKGLGKYFKSRTAYGIGIGFPPNWAEGHIYAIKPDEPMILEENMTFHIIPTLFREEFGMAISDSVRVTNKGCELLTHYPRELVIID